MVQHVLVTLAMPAAGHVVWASSSRQTWGRRRMIASTSISSSATTEPTLLRRRIAAPLVARAFSICLIGFPSEKWQSGSRTALALLGSNDRLHQLDQLLGR
jgi:hypothetical protein